MYDIIGDIHGHGDELNSLLTELGYKDLGKGYCHESRKVIFLGDFIDRGEELAQHKMVLSTVMSMVKNQQAHAVMGNHEFNALAYHTRHEGEFLRPHNDDNKRHNIYYFLLGTKILLANTFLIIGLWNSSLHDGAI